MSTEIQESELIQQAQDLQIALEEKIKGGNKSLSLITLNRNLKIGLTVAMRTSADLRPEKKERRWGKSTTTPATVNEVAKPEAVKEKDKTFLETLKGKSAEELKKTMNKTSLLAVVKAINESEPDESKRLTPEEGATNRELCELIFNYLNPAPDNATGTDEETTTPATE